MQRFCHEGAYREPCKSLSASGAPGNQKRAERLSEAYMFVCICMSSLFWNLIHMNCVNLIFQKSGMHLKLYYSKHTSVYFLEHGTLAMWHLLFSHFLLHGLLWKAAILLTEHLASVCFMPKWASHVTFWWSGSVLCTTQGPFHVRTFDEFVWLWFYLSIPQQPQDGLTSRTSAQ